MSYKFEKLTPINDVKLDGYKEALDFAFQNRDIRNIAITGSYSSGKSSVIETYKSINKDIKLMHISLAHFSTVCDSTFEKDNYAETVEIINKSNNSSLPWESFGDNGMILLYKYLL